MTTTSGATSVIGSGVTGPAGNPHDARHSAS